jgi:selenide,water dikinase
LVGGGHAHVQVLKDFTLCPPRGVRLTLISPESYATYSGMVPGYLAGQYQLRDAQIDVRALAAQAHAAFVADRVVRVDAAGRCLQLDAGPPVPYDFLSLDDGLRPRGTERVTAAARAAMVKPIEEAARQIDAAFASPATEEGRRIVVVGAGAGGTEIAFALAARLRNEGRGTVTLCDSAATPLAERGRRVAGLVARALTRLGIDFVGGVPVERLDEDGVRLADGRHIAADFVVWATGAAGPDFLRTSGLPVDDRGFLRVDDDLRCVAHAEIFAAGDCATMESHPTLAKAGVYAVRQGPVLAGNLRAAVEGTKRFDRYQPQRRFLSLLNTGDGKAILSYGCLAWHGRLPWKLKDYIDRSFIGRF